MKTNQKQFSLKGGPPNKQCPISGSFRYWFSILGTAALFRALVGLYLLRDFPSSSDAASYEAQALRLLAEFPGNASFYWPPGTSLSLAAMYGAFGYGFFQTRILLIVLGLVAVALTVLLTDELFEDRSVAWIAGMIAACYVPSILLIGQPYSQHLASVCVLAFSLAGLRMFRSASKVYAILAGATLGVGILTRPSMGILALLLLPFCLPRDSTPGGMPASILSRLHAGLRSHGAPLLLFLAALLLVILPIQYHNDRCGAGWTVSTNNERNFFLGNNRYTPNYKTSQLGQRSYSDLPPEVTNYLRSIIGDESLANRRSMMREALGYMATHPLLTIYRIANRFRAFWGFDYLAARTIQVNYAIAVLGPPGLSLLALEAGSYILVFALAIIGVVLQWGQSASSGKGWILAVVLCYSLPYCIAFSHATYHYPILWLLIPFSAAALRLARQSGPRMFCNLILHQRAAWAPLLLFGLIQIEYAYQTFVNAF